MSTANTGTGRVKRGLAEMLKGGVIMDVVNAEQARIAEDAGAVAVMALERVPADIRAQGGVSRMSDPDMIDSIIASVSIPVMAKSRIGHFVEAQVLQTLGVDFIDESEVLSPADYVNHIDKWNYTVPFVCGATNLGEALRRINEGAAMIRSKGEAGTGDVSEATKHIRKILGEINARGVDLYLHTQGLDTSTPAGRAMFSMLGVFAELERSILRQRIMSGLARSDKRSGRPPLDPEKVERIKRSLAKGTSINATAKKLKVGVATVHRLKQQMARAA